MPPEIKTYLSYREINNGTASTLEEFRSRLSGFPMQPLLRACSVFNTRLASWVGEYDFDFHSALVRAAFPPDVAERMIATNRLAFHRHQLLFAAQEALRLCNNTEKAISGPYMGGLGTVLLMASDHLSQPTPEIVRSADDIVQIVCSFIPTHEANGLNSYLMKMARSQYMLSRFIEPLRATGLFFDVHAMFQQTTGIPLEVYQAMLFAALARFGKFDKLRTSTEPADFGIPKTWFRTTSVSEDTVESFLREVAATSQDLSQKVREKSPRANDFTAFKDKPILREPEYSFPIDMAFLAEKFDSAPFWRIHNDCLSTKSERDNFHSFWGHVFEGYMNWLLGESFLTQVNRLVPDPRFACNTDQQVCDAVILCDRTAILVEYKGSTFTAAGKYGGDAGPLKKEMEEKLVGTEAAAKGVRQLVRATERLCRFEDNRAISGLDLSGVTTLVPLIITRDDLGSVFGMNAYLNRRFQELRLEKHTWRAVTPLFCLSADDVEKISPYLSDTSLSAILEARYRSDKPLMGSLLLLANRVLDRKGERKPTILLDTIKATAKQSNQLLGLAADVNG